MPPRSAPSPTDQLLAKATSAKALAAKATSARSVATKSSARGHATASSSAPLSGPADSLPVLSFADPAAFGAWLAVHHGSSPGGWLRQARKGCPERLITYPQALDVALCWGWIDGQKRSLDEVAFLQKFTPRRPRSLWSQVNRDKVLALIASGTMQPPGLAEIERARQDGRWEAAYSPASRAEVPADLLAALAANPIAAAFFATLNAQNRYAVIFRLQTAKRAETRSRRLENFVAMCARGDKLHP